MLTPIFVYTYNERVGMGPLISVYDLGATDIIRVRIIRNRRGKLKNYYIFRYDCRNRTESGPNETGFEKSIGVRVPIRFSYVGGRVCGKSRAPE